MGANKKIHSASEVAKALVGLSDPEKGDIVTNLKLQKLLYYTQGFHIAIFDVPIFEERIEAWQYGPVVPAVYREYKDNGANGITLSKPFDFKVFDKEQRELIHEIYDVYGQFSALKLMQMTHEESPWKNAGISGIISLESLSHYFKKVLNA